MRALFLKNYEFLEQSEIYIENEDFHHLKNVLRIKLGEKILLLNGQGKSTKSQITSIHRNHLVLKTETVKEEKNNFSIDIALASIKKDGLIEAIKKVVECGYGAMHIFESDYSQKSTLKPEKLAKILKNSYEQSNSKYELEIREYKSFELIDLDHYESIVLFNSFKNENSTPHINGKCLVVIGPEGGFSNEEIEKFKKYEQLVEIHAEANIMRSPTACSYAKGHVQSLLNMRT